MRSRRFRGALSIRRSGWGCPPDRSLRLVATGRCSGERDGGERALLDGLEEFPDRRRQKTRYRTPAPLPQRRCGQPRGADPGPDGPIPCPDPPALVTSRYRTEGSGVKRKLWASGRGRAWVEIGRAGAKVWQRPERGGAGKRREQEWCTRSGQSGRQGHQPRYALGGPRSAASVAKPSERSMARIVPGSRMLAMSRNRPPHARQTSTSEGPLHHDEPRQP
jgi:hypothetical protein